MLTPRTPYIGASFGVTPHMYNNNYLVRCVCGVSFWIRKGGPELIIIHRRMSFLLILQIGMPIYDRAHTVTSESTMQTARQFNGKSREVRRWVDEPRAACFFWELTFIMCLLALSSHNKRQFPKNPAEDHFARLDESSKVET